MNPDCKLTDFKREELLALARAVFKVLRIKLYDPDEKESLELWYTQIINALNSIDATDRVLNN
jgi:hypothetical protein